MKIGVGKRILMFLHWFVSLLIFAALVISIYFPPLMAAAWTDISALLGPYAAIGRIVLAVVVAVIYAALCIAQASLIFKRKTPRSERGFITVDSSDNSKVRIAISAIEQMVRQSVNSIDGISDMKVAIDSSDDAIEIKINASILAGRHVPTITMNMQQAIRRFVEMNCGVAVRTVAVNIYSVTNADGNGKKKNRTKNAKAENSSATYVYDVPASASEPIEMAVATESDVPGFGDEAQAVETMPVSEEIVSPEIENAESAFDEAAPSEEDVTDKQE